METKKIRKKCRTVPKKIERGDPLVSAGFVGYVKKVKKGGTLWRQKNYRKKCRTVPKKNRKGDSLGPSGFVGYLEKKKMKGGTLCTKFALAPLPDWAP